MPKTISFDYNSRNKNANKLFTIILAIKMKFILYYINDLFEDLCNFASSL